MNEIMPKGLRRKLNTYRNLYPKIHVLCNDTILIKQSNCRHKISCMQCILKYFRNATLSSLYIVQKAVECNLTLPRYCHHELASSAKHFSFVLILRLLGLHYNHYVSQTVRPSICPSVHKQLVKMFITLKPHGILGSHLAYICMSTFPETTYWMDEGLLSISPACCGQRKSS